MAKQLYQIRYNTVDANIAKEDGYLLTRDDTFAPYTAHGGIEQLGIQAPPGTKFYINSSPDPVMVGGTGIYELNLANQIAITTFRFDQESIENIKKTSNLSLLIDMIYREG